MFIKPKYILTTFITLSFICSSHAGVNFAMTVYTIPKFANESYSVAYAHAVKGNIVVIREFESRCAELRKSILANQHAGDIQKAVDNASADIREYRILKAGLDVMNKYKEAGDVGATFVVSSVPVI